jgi:hypothetical protein
MELPPKINVVRFVLILIIALVYYSLIVFNKEITSTFMEKNTKSQKEKIEY